MLQASFRSVTRMCLNFGLPLVGVLELVLNLTLAPRLFTLGMMGINVLSLDARKVMLGLLFCEPGTEPDGAFVFYVTVLSRYFPCSNS